MSLIDDSARQMENKMRLPQWGKSVRGYESEKEGEGEGRAFSGVDLHFNLHPMQSTYI